MSVTAVQIESTLREKLSPTALTVNDDSDKHAGHPGARAGGHFSVYIEAAAFMGLPPVARHRLVYDALHPLLARGIHALAIQAKVPSV